jgi:hypothetical protein
MLLLHDCGLHRRDGFCHPVVFGCLSLGQCNGWRKLWQSCWIFRWMVRFLPSITLLQHPDQDLYKDLTDLQ